MGSKSTYSREAERERDKLRKRRARANDVTIPPVVNPRRKKRAIASLRCFIESYFTRPPSRRYPGRRAWCSSKFDALHYELIEDCQRVALYGGQIAVAAPRGSGKDTILKCTTLWVTLCGHSHYPILVSYKQDDAETMLLAGCKEQLEINDWLYEDFPEVCAPVRALEGAPQRAKTMTVAGERVRMEWQSSHVVLPSIEGSLASGRVIGTGSVNGAIRGRNVGGRRPDLVVLTDPQDRDVARSPQRVQETMDLIAQDFGGLGSHTEPLACVALVTVIRKDDVADRLTNRQRHPEWNGRKYVAIARWPDRMDLWEQYEELCRQGQRTGEDPNCRIAHRFYLKNRKAMDAGSEVFWRDGYIRHLAEDGKPLEASGLQHLMNMRYRLGHDAFEAEFQNNPVSTTESLYDLTEDHIIYRQHPYELHVVPPEVVRVVQGIDIGDREIHYTLIGVAADATPYCLGYGIYVLGVDQDPDLQESGGVFAEPIARVIMTMLRQHRSTVAAGLLKRPDGEPVRVDLTLVDSGWRPEVVYRFVAESGPAYRATRGRGASQGLRAYTKPQPADNTLVGENWFAKRQPEGIWLWHLNADYWKHCVFDALRQQPGTPGAYSLFRQEPVYHRMYASHILAERWDPEQSRWVLVTRYNHYLDTTYLAFCAAAMTGIKREPVITSSHTEPRPAPRKPDVPALPQSRETSAPKQWIPRRRTRTGWMRR